MSTFFFPSVFLLLFWFVLSLPLCPAERAMQFDYSTFSFSALIHNFEEMVVLGCRGTGEVTLYLS